MGLDFDAQEYCKSVKQTNPPYACPVPKCDRSYKTIIGLQYHLSKYDHDNPQPLTPVLTPQRKKARARSTHATPKGIRTLGVAAADGASDSNGQHAQSAQQNTNPEHLVTYNEQEQTVQFNIEGKSVRQLVDEPLPLIDEEQFESLRARGRLLNADAPPLEQNAAWARVKVPVARFCEIPDYNVPDAPARSLAYYRFIEKSAEELDGEIEYDVDEEDTAWLEWMNETREKAGLTLVSIDTMELLMDRLEKESYFQAAANGTSTGVEVDDDAVCCICMDGECQNTNVILFCDMCNLAVHQDCYGVPYIPEGQWLCRRCLQSPSTPVSCVLCPNTGGAFKQTDHGQWAHVVCALWIPEVRFANTVFLEPIDSIETIPAARLRLTCYVCKEKGLGACIQCHRHNCYAAFHVTCAQQAGLYMTMDTVNDGHNDSSVHVQKYAYCHAHTPADAKLKTNQNDFEDTRHKMKEARKALAKKRSSAPVVLIPTIPADRMQEIASMVHMQKKQAFLERLMAYWTLKRQYRNGVPLLRRLQSQGNHHSVIHRNGIEGSPDTAELYRQLKYWQCLRQDLERARLLCELVRKREKVKAALVKISEQELMMRLNPLESALTKLLDTLESKDTLEIFREPVDTQEVPDYLDIVKQPMDLGTMREKLRQGHYTTLEQLETDFDLMIQNCLAYNNKDTVFYRAGIRMRDQAAPIITQTRRQLQREGLLDVSNTDNKDHVELEVEKELRELLEAKPSEEIVQKLLILADKSQVLKNPAYRTKKIKQIRVEISRMRKTLLKQRFAARHSLHATHAQSDDEEEQQQPQPQKRLKETAADKEQQTHLPTKRARRATIVMEQTMLEDNVSAMGDESKETNNSTAQTPPCSPIKNVHSSASPVGVNRRTAVLFTRKAQAALKRPAELTSTPVKEENNANNMSGALAMNHHNSTAAAAVATLVSTALSINNKLTGNLALNTTLISRKSPKRNSRHKRLCDVRNNLILSGKKSATAMPMLTTTQQQSSGGDLSYDRIPDSFRVYRANNARDGSDSDENDISDLTGSPCSSCTGDSHSGSGTDYDDSTDEEHEHETQETMRAAAECDEDEEDDDDDDDEDDDNDDDEEEEEEEQEDEDVDEEAANTKTRVKRHATAATVITDNNGVMEKSSSDDSNSESSGSAEQTIAKLKNTKRVLRHTPVPASASKTTTAPQTRRQSIARAKSATPAPTAAKTNNSAAAQNRSQQQQQKTMTTRSATPSNLNAVNNLKTNAKNAKGNVLSEKPSMRARSMSVAVARRATPKRNKLNNTTTTTTTAAAATTTTTKTTTTTTATVRKHIANNNLSPVKVNNDNKPPTLREAKLEPLQLVWAKCRGYPWYPALILDPKTPKGFVFNGVPLPAPPPDVLALRKNCIDDVVFLVLFFDAKRTWQWLPANKLEKLGVDTNVDHQKLFESRKPTERKAVKKAYQEAMRYQSQVSDLEGQGPDPIM